jgi:hypothetical protein
VSVAQPRVRVKPSVNGGAKTLGQSGGEPVVTLRQEGKGQCLYVGVPIGAVNFEPELRNGTQGAFERNAKAADLLVRLVKKTSRAPFDFHADAAPREVGMCAFVVEDGGKRQVLVHLLNMGAMSLPKGQVVPNTAPPQGEVAFPPLKQDLVFQLRWGNVFGGHVVSPEYEGRRPVAVARQPDGLWQVTVAKADLVGYALVRLNVE